MSAKDDFLIEDILKGVWLPKLSVVKESLTTETVDATPPSRSASVSEKRDEGVAPTALQNLPAEFLNVGRASRLPGSGSKRDACAIFFGETMQ